MPTSGLRTEPTIEPTFESASTVPVPFDPMAESNVLKRFLDAGLAFTQLTQARAEAIVKDLVNAGEVQTSQAQSTVAELMEKSRQNTERLLDQVRGDISAQIGNLGLATKADVARLERQISSLSSSASAAAKKPPTRAAATKGAATKKAAKRTPAKAAAKKR